MKTFFRLLWITLALTTTVSAQTESFDIATFVRPAGWTRVESPPDGALILQEVKTGTNRADCSIVLFPSVPAHANAAVIFQTEWDTKIKPVLGISVTPSPKPQTTSDGWTILTGSADSIQGGLPLRTMLMVSTGFGKEFSVVVTVAPNSCQQEIVKFFSGLSLNANAAGQSSPAGGMSSDRNAVASPKPGSDAGADNLLNNYMYVVPPQWTQQAARDRQPLAGDWITATSTVGLRYTFLANGRYKGAVASQHSSATVTTTQAFFGDGTYSTDGNTLVLTGDDQRRSTMFFRVQKVSKDSGQSWGDELCLLKPGATGEVCYRRE
jgi:hypothetical protein